MSDDSKNVKVTDERTFPIEKKERKRRKKWYHCSWARKSNTKKSLFLPMYNVGKTPFLLTCPNCRSTDTTHVDLISTKETHLAALFFLPLLLCWLPYCTVTFRKARHHCSVCGAFIGETQ